MSIAEFKIPSIVNEPVLSYVKGSPEREQLIKAIAKMKSEKADIPMYIGGERIQSKEKIAVRPPHDHQHVLGKYNKANATHVQKAIQAALRAKAGWENMPWQERAAIFLKAADLLSGPYRARMNAATMLGQSKNVFQAEIDAVAELCDFLRFNAQFMAEIYQQQPISAPLIWNRM